MGQAAEGRGAGGGALTVGQWIALNDEIAALVRSGLPLEAGLRSTGADLNDRLGRTATALADSLGRGEGLSEALAGLGDRLPPSYRAVVEAGSRSGRLASALEGVADHARQAESLRRSLGLALLYPLIVLGVGYGLLIGFLTLLLPVIAEASETFRLPATDLLRAAAIAGRSARYWWPVGPALLLIALLLWWQSGRANASGGMARRALGVLPWFGGMLRLSTWASFTDLLALLIEHGTPLGESLVLAGRTAADPELRAAAERLADRVTAGGGTGDRPVGLPPMVGWLLRSGQGGDWLVEALRRAAEAYRRRARIEAEVVRTALPMAAMLVVGGGTVLLYGLTLFLPLSILMDQLGEVGR